MVATLNFPAITTLGLDVAPNLTWESAPSVNPPHLVLGLQLGIVGGDHAIIEISDAVDDGDGGLESDGVWTTYLDVTIADAEADDQTVTGVATLAAGPYVLRAHMTRGATSSPTGGEININITVTAVAATGVSTDTSVSDTAPSTAITFTSQAIGSASATRIVVVAAFSYLGGANGTVSGVTVGGTGLTQVCAVGEPDWIVDMWAGNITTGTTADIVVTTDASQYNTAIAVAAIDNVNATATDFCAKIARGGEGTPYTTTTPLTVPTDGIGVVAGWAFNTSAADFTNLTKDLDTLGPSSRIIIGLVTTPGDISPSMSNVNFAGLGLVAAAWGP